MQAIHGNPHTRPQLDEAGGIHQAAATAPGAPQKAGAAGRTVVDRVDLSDTAQELTGHAGSGKAASSPAHQARGAIELHPELADLPFGQVVKAINHGTLESLIAPVEEPVADATLAPEGTEQPAPATDAPEAAVTDDAFTGVVDEIVADAEADDPAAPEAVPEPGEASADETTDGVAIPAPDGVDLTDELLAALSDAEDGAIIDNTI